MRALLSSVGLVAALAGVCSCDFRPAGSEGQGDDAPAPIDAPQPTTDGRATDAPPPTDARMIDAPPPYDPANCPSGYDLAYGNRRYRLAFNFTSWGSGRDDCAGDRPGWTHHLVLDDEAERQGLISALLNFARVDYWLGVHKEGGTVRTVTGQTNFIPNTGLGNGQALYWSTGASATGTFTADSKNGLHWTLCECDGLPSLP